ncbi:MAG: helix-turn-helix domain-containing protein [Candidatus Acidiferrales bacterium]
MPVDQAELARRIRDARESCALTQEDAAEKLGVSRSTLSQIELGNRPISSVELESIAQLFGRGIEEFFAAEFSPDEMVAVLFRAQPEASAAGLHEAIRNCMAVGRELTNLEELLGLDRGAGLPVAYPQPTPNSKWEAVQLGASAAQEERQRLGFGSAPLGDMVRLLEGQGVRTGVTVMPDDVSGLTINHPAVGVFVVINGAENYAPQRQRFSWSHEYAHVLLDRERRGLVSRTSDRENLLEVRANAFAAGFLLPEEGVREFLAGIGKGQPTRFQAEVFDEAGVLAVEGRTEPGSQNIQFHEIVQLAHHFGVSRLAALYRLRNLRLITEADLVQFREADEQGKGKEIEKILKLKDDAPGDSGELTRRFVGLALEALRREVITRTKFQELAKSANLAEVDANALLAVAGLGGASDSALPTA